MLRTGTRPNAKNRRRLQNENMAGDADEKARRHRNGQKVGDEAELERAGANENEPDREAERRRGCGVMLRPRRREHRKRASENRRDGRIGANREAPAVAEEREPDRGGDESKQTDLRREVGKTRGRHLRGNGDRRQRQTGDHVGAEVARAPACERPQNEPRARSPKGRGGPLFVLLRHLSRASGTEALSVILRAHALEPREPAPHRLFRAETAARSDPLGRQARVGQQLASRLDAQPLDRPRRRDARRLAIAAQEGALAHARLRSESGERQVLGEVFGQPIVQVRETLVRQLKRQRRAELRLPARPLKEHHQLARNAERKRASEIFFHERKRQVDAGRHSGRGPQRAIVHEDRIRLHCHGRMAPAELITIFPMRDGAAMIKQTCCGEQERAGAHRGGPPRGAGAELQPFDQARILGGLHDATAAGHDQRVERFGRFWQRLGRERQSRCGPYLRAFRSDHPRLVGRVRRVRPLVGGGEHLDRPGYVQHLNVREGQHLDTARGFFDWPRRLWRDLWSLWRHRQIVPD